jgi:hypothetical protein
MSVTWSNIYMTESGAYICASIQDQSVEENQYFAGLPQNVSTWIGRQEFWNGIPLRPPVCIRAEQCSHRWNWCGLYTDITDIIYTHKMTLEKQS